MRLKKLPVMALLAIGVSTNHVVSLGAATTSAETPNQAPNSEHEVIRFMEALKANRPPSRKFSVNEVPSWDPKAISGFIFSAGVTVEDVNTKVVKKYSPEEVERALTAKKSKVFKSFSHISFLYAKGKPQYSQLKVTTKGAGVLAVLATWYELEFVSIEGHLKLRRCKYINRDAD